MWMGLVALSLFSILVLNFSSEIVPGTRFDGTGSYVILGVLAFALMRWLRVWTLTYFAWPKFGWRFLVASLLMLNLIVVQVRNEEFSDLDAWQWVRGAIFLVAVATTEEIFSRGIVFGVLQRQGLFIAVMGSSVMFGLMHINSYVGEYFDPWRAYWHVMSATSFGIFACALMVVTRSIWMPIILHTFSNIGLLFSNIEEVTKVRSTPVSVEFWSGVIRPLPAVLTFVIPALILFWINAGMPLHPVLHRLAVKWKLVELQEKELTV